MRQLRFVMVLLAVFAALVVFQAATAPAATATGLSLDSVFLQVYSEKMTVMDAGVGSYTTYGDAECSTTASAVAKDSVNVTVLSDRFGVTSETRWIKIVTVVKDVKSNQIVGISQAAVTSGNERTLDGIRYKIVSPYELWVDGWSLPEFTRFTPVVVQNASKKDHRILWLVHITKHFERENTTDIFVHHKDISNELVGLTLDQPQLALDMKVLDGYKALPADSEFRRLFRAYVYSRYATIDLSDTALPYQIASDGRAQRVQGQQQQQYEAGLAKLRSAYEQQLRDAKTTITDLTQKLNDTQPKVWSLKVGTSPTGAWHVWVCWTDKNGVLKTEGPLYVADQVIQFNGGPGTYWVEVQPYDPHGTMFNHWHRYDVASAGQQLEVN